MTNQFPRKLTSPLVWLTAITISGAVVSLLAVIGVVTRMRRRDQTQSPPSNPSRRRTRIEPLP